MGALHVTHQAGLWIWWGGVEEIGLESIYEELPTNMPAFLVTLL